MFDEGYNESILWYPQTDVPIVWYLCKPNIYGWTDFKKCCMLVCLISGGNNTYTVNA